MKLIELYAIRHKASGRFMPQRMFKQSAAGFSYWEPSSVAPGDWGYDQTPRLFQDTLSANLAAKAWERGYHSRSYNDDGFSFSRVDPSPVRRNPGDLEIVTFVLKEKTL